MFDVGPLPKLLDALRVTVETPAADGVPLMMPVVASSVRPDGRLVAEKEVGLLLARRSSWP